MGRLLRLNTKSAVVLYLIVDLLCVGMGMGVPVFCILLGFVTGWYLARRAVAEGRVTRTILRRVLLGAILASAVTFVLMAAVWGPVVPMAFDSGYDFENFGIPMLLFEPWASFVGWLVLMILVSPFLQLLTTVFAGYVTLVSEMRANGAAD
jgi:hypothetical protein